MTNRLLACVNAVKRFAQHFASLCYMLCSLVICYDEEVFGCGVGRLRVREGGVMCGVHCVSEGIGEERGGVMLMGSCVVILQGDSAFRECILVNGLDQER